MAVVYLARDAKHDRPVAVKVLDAALAGLLGPERFVREVRVTARLQHPHVLPLLDSGVLGPEAGALAGRPYYVMPYVEGESLRQRLAREGPLPVADAVRIATEVAAALDYAHRHGVVHRDVKPENVLLHDGSALVADFGIALAVATAGGGRVTGTGLALGTPPYMAPEQAAAERTVDARTDVYALGAMLYELLAGEPPFTGPSAQAIVARALTDTPRPLTAQRPSVPPHVDAAVRRALEKLPGDRWPTAAAFAAALQDVGATWATSPALGAPPATGRRDSGWRAWLRDPVWLARALAGMSVVALLGAGAAVWSWKRAGPAPAVVRLTFALPPTQRLADVSGSPVLFAPNERAIVYSARTVGDTGSQRLYYRPLDALEGRPLPGTEGAVSPFFSPDGQWVGFFVGLVLRKVPVSGGSAVTLGGVPGWLGASWGPDDTIVGGSPRGLWRVPAAGGELSFVTRTDTARHEVSHAGPRVLPGGESVVFVHLTLGRGGDMIRRIGVVSLRTKRATLLEQSAGNVLGFLDGRLLIGHPDGTIAALPFDPEHGRMTGPAEPLLSEEVAHKFAGGAEASLADDGSIVYVRGGARTRLTLVDATGRETGGPPQLRGTLAHASRRTDGRSL
jgi:serine/threonine-protein kinase